MRDKQRRNNNIILVAGLFGAGLRCLSVAI